MGVATRTDRPAQRRIQRWDPFRDIEELHSALGELMADALPADALFTPPVDIEETEDGWVIEAELPGVNREDINVEVRDSEVHVTGEVKERERRGILRRRTRKVGQFELRVNLPGPADADRVDATLHDGVLTLRIPKPEQARPHRIEVKAD